MENYWEEAMKNRMNSREEVHRLEMVLKGFLYQHNEWAKEHNLPHEIMTPIEFWDTKRPYGNKDIPASIAFNLGWDNKRVLMKEAVPKNIQEEAWKLHELLKIELEKWDNYS